MAFSKRIDFGTAKQFSLRGHVWPAGNGLASASFGAAATGCCHQHVSFGPCSDVYLVGCFFWIGGKGDLYSRIAAMVFYWDRGIVVGGNEVEIQ